jgi:hypothetical protein
MGLILDGIARGGERTPMPPGPGMPSAVQAIDDALVIATRRKSAAAEAPIFA